VKILEDNTKSILATGYISLLVGAMLLGFTAFPQSTHASSTPVGIAIPLYTYPTDGTWTAVINAKQSYPNVPFIAVINPSSGPGPSKDPNYVQGIKNLQAAGITVLGYVATGYITLTFTAAVGVTYTISMSNWKNYVFDHWDNGSTNPVRAITATQTTTLVAYYKIG
jgi:hypothetical protein